MIRIIFMVTTNRIATESPDVRLNPVQAEQLILNAKVAADAEAGKTQKSQWSETIVDRNDNRSGSSKVAAVIGGIRNTASKIPSTVDPDLHRQVVASSSVGWRPDIEIETRIDDQPTRSDVIELQGPYQSSL